MRGRWLTPDELPDTGKCWAITIPDSVEFLALLKGCLDELRFSSNFEAFGSLTPDDVASAFAVAFDTLAECAGSGLVTGEIIAYATSNAPTGTLACDGSSHLRVDYPALYAVLATAFITDADHFVVPDLRGRSIVGIGQGSGLTNRAMNASGGEENHQLSVAELASHHHEYQLDTWGSFAAAGSAVGTQINRVLNDTTDTGSGTAHNTMHPFRALGYAIVT